MVIVKKTFNKGNAVQPSLEAYNLFKRKNGWKLTLRSGWGHDQALILAGLTKNQVRKAICLFSRSGFNVQSVSASIHKGLLK